MSDRMMSLKADADYTFDSDSDSDVESGRRAPPMTKSKTEPSLGHVHSVNGGWACDTKMMRIIGIFVFLLGQWIANG